jgi:hypothetical protein
MGNGNGRTRLDTVPGRRGVVILLVCLALTAAACGGDDEGSIDEQSTSAPETTDAGAAGGEPATDAPEGDGEDSSDDGTTPPGDSGPSRATVTVGGETYEADLSGSLAVCISMGGAVGGSGPIDGIDGGSIDIDIPPEDYETSTTEWEPPSIRVDLGEDENGVPIDWRAGGDLVLDDPTLVGKSQVDSFEVEGSSAIGTATFIDVFQVQLFAVGQVEEPQPVQGSFAIACG